MSTTSPNFLPAFLRHSSLEVAIGAMAANVAAHRYLSGQVHFGMEQVLLGLATISIYGIDRLADVWRGHALKPSHRFYKENFSVMAWYTGICAVVGLVLAILVPIGLRFCKSGAPLPWQQPYTSSPFRLHASSSFLT